MLTLLPPGDGEEEEGGFSGVDGLSFGLDMSLTTGAVGLLSSVVWAEDDEAAWLDEPRFFDPLSLDLLPSFAFFLSALS